MYHVTYNFLGETDYSGAELLLSCNRRSSGFKHKGLDINNRVYGLGLWVRGGVMVEGFMLRVEGLGFLFLGRSAFEGQLPDECLHAGLVSSLGLQVLGA